MPSDNTARKVDGFLESLPPHKAGLCLEHNPHQPLCASVGQHLGDLEAMGVPSDWPSEEAKARAIETGDFWELTWHPDTSVGSCCVAAPTLAELFEFLDAEAA